MAIKPKDAVFQMRIDEQLLQDFKTHCAHADLVPSALVRQWIRGWTDQAIVRSQNKSREGNS